MQPIIAFNAALERSKHLLVLYEILHDSRQRSVRDDWAIKFKGLMRWPQTEIIHRVDGKDRNTILIMRDCLGVNRRHFAHEYLSELLRASLVAAISALDRYLHDVVLHHSIYLLSKKEEDIPKELRKLSIPVLETKRALASLRANSSARPGHILKKAIQEHLHGHFTFQNPDSVQKAAQMLGIEDFWTKVAEEMSPAISKKEVISKLREHVIRRNQIVHEADLLRKTKSRGYTLREVDLNKAKDVVNWTNDFVKAIDNIIEKEIR
jgi:hypothetical protein